MKTSLPHKRTALLLSAALSALLMLTAGAAVASAANPSIVSPKRGKVFAAGSRPTFKVKDTTRAAAKYKIYMTVSNKKSFKRSGAGRGDLIAPKGAVGGTFTSMSRRGSIFTYKTELLTFPGWFGITPGKYYWQAYHIDCGLPKGACHKHTKLGSFVIR